MNGLINTSSNSTVSWVWTNSPLHLRTQRTWCLPSRAAGPQQCSGTAEPVPVAAIWGWSGGWGSPWWHWHYSWHCGHTKPLPWTGWCRSSAARGKCNFMWCLAVRLFSGCFSTSGSSGGFPWRTSSVFSCWQPFPGSL